MTEITQGTPKSILQSKLVDDGCWQQLALASVQAP